MKNRFQNNIIFTYFDLNTSYNTFFYITSYKYAYNFKFKCYLKNIENNLMLHNLKNSAYILDGIYVLKNQDKTLNDNYKFKNLLIKIMNQ